MKTNPHFRAPRLTASPFVKVCASVLVGVLCSQQLFSIGSSKPDCGGGTIITPPGGGDGTGGPGGPGPGDPGPTGPGSGFGCYVQYQTAAFIDQKCGFAAYQQLNPPRVDYYVHQTSYATNGHYLADSGIGIPGEWNGYCQTLDSGSWWYLDTATYALTHIEDYDKLTCQYFESYTGGETAQYYTEDQRDWYCTNPNEFCDPSYVYWSTSHWARVSSTHYYDYQGTTQWVWVTDYSRQDGSDITNACSSGEGYSTESETYTNGVSMPPPSGQLQSLSPTRVVYTMYPPAPGYEGSHTLELTNLFTDQDLRGKILAQIPAYSGNWYTPGFYSGDDLLYRVAYSRVHDGTRFRGTLQKMRYRFAVPGSQAQVTYNVSWDLITWDVLAGTVSVRNLSTSVVGTGDPITPAYSGDIDEPPPPWTAAEEGVVVTWLDNVSVSVATATAAGSGPGAAAGTGSGGCCGPGNSPPPAAAAQFSLGRAAGGYSAGYLSFWSDLPGTTLATPAALRSSAPASAVTLVTISNQIRQAKVPETLVDVVTVDAFKYEARFYLPSQFTTQTNGYGLYEPIGSPTPFVTWRVENPDASTNSFNRLRLTEIRGGDSKIYDFTYTSATKTWLIAQPGGLREDEISTTITPTEDGYYRTVTTTTRVPGQAAQFKATRVYQKIGAQDGKYEMLLSETLSPDANPRTTTYLYDSYSSYNGTFQPLKQINHPDGSWQYFQYHPDGGGRLLYSYSGIADQPAPENQSPDTQTSRFVSRSYSPLAPGDDGTRWPYAPRTITTYMRDIVVALSYGVALPGEWRDIRCQRTDALWDSADNLVTVTKYFTTGPNLNRVQSVLRPDGTMTIYDYATAVDGTQTNTVSSGQPNAGKTAIIDGARTVTIIGPVGQMISSTSTDIASGVITAQDTYGDYDTLNRPQRVTHLDGTSEYSYYTCCGLDRTVDRDGVSTYYSYDSMKRLTGTTRLNIVTTTILDAAGRAVSTIRTGSDASQITLSQSTFDLAGRLLGETNALGGVTTYAESADPVTGGLIRTTTFPDLGTRIEAFYLDGGLKKVTGTAAQPVRYEQDINLDYGTLDYGLPYSKEVKLNTDGSDSGEWTISYSDLLGRSTHTVYADNTPGDPDDNPITLSFYNTVGQLWKEVDPDGVTTLFQYNLKGELQFTAVDMDRDDLIDFAQTDRITASGSFVTTATAASGTYVRRSTNSVWATDNQNVALCLATNEVSTNGLRAWTFTPGGTNESRTVYAGAYRYVTNTAPDKSLTISQYLNGRLITVTRKDAAGVQLAKTTYGYDAHGRQNSVTDARNGASTTTFNNADLVASVTTPHPGTPGSAPQTTWTFYNKMLQATNVVSPDGVSRFSSFWPSGQLKRSWGGRDYPVEYGYDYAGRMKTMKTWQNFASDSGTAITTWNYNPYRGWLDNKRYADSSGPDYTYYASGRLKERIWARGNPRLKTTYSYNNAGNLSTVDYSDTTPHVSFGHDRRGRQSTATSGTIVTTLAYNNANELVSESFSGGPLNGLAVTNGFDMLMRRTAAGLNTQPSTLIQYGYDPASRLVAVTNGTSTFGYTYLANSPLLEQTTFKNSGTLRMSTTRQHDYLGRLTSISSVPSAAAAINFACGYNQADQRTRATLADASYWRFDYDSLGQVTCGAKYWSDGTPVAGQQFQYAFDDIGNRLQTKSGGDENGSNLRSAAYSANSLNQYSGRDVPGYAEITGISFATNTVTVNAQTAYRKGEYFRKEVLINNASAPQWTAITVAATGQTSVTGNVLLAKSPETITHDADGNLSSDGLWTHTWNAENRLVKIESLATVPTAARAREEWTYLPDGRWIERIVSTNNGTSYFPAFTNRYVWDGRLLLAVLDHTDGVLASFTRGLDLGGSIDGVGGAGGVLAVNLKNNGTHFCAFDGNGNTAALVSASDGTESARYEYGPFAEPVRVTGAVAKLNPLRFSTQYADEVTGDTKYLYRDYSPSTGRWRSRDPLTDFAFSSSSAADATSRFWGSTDSERDFPDETSQPSPFTFVANAPSALIDISGLYKMAGRRHIRPDRCEMVIIYAHSNGKRDRWIWHMRNTPSAGAAVTCFPGANIHGLGDNNLWPEAEEIINELIWWLPLTDVSAQNSIDVPRNKYRDINAQAAMYTQVLPRVLNKIGDFCKVCRQVTVTFIRVRKNGTIVPNPTGKSDDPKWPNIPSSVVPCSGGGTDCP